MRVFGSLMALGLCLGVAGQAKADYTFTTLDVPGSDTTFANGINDSGQIVGNYLVPPGHHNFGYLLIGGSYTNLSELYPIETPIGINNLGQIVGTHDAGGRINGFLLSGTSFTVFDVPGSSGTRPTGINDSGQIVGDYTALDPTRDPGNPNPTFLHGFLLSGGSYTTLDVAGAFETHALAINNSGQIVGYSIAGGLFHGFLLSGGSYTTIDVPGATFTRAFGINDSGQIVGDYHDADGRSHGFLLSGGSYITIDPPGSAGTVPFGINASGQISGSYGDAGGNHGFLAIPTAVPEPSALTLLGIGTLCVLGSARCRWRRDAP